MTLKTSLLITGDSSVAQKAIGDLNKTMQALGYGTKETAATTERLRQVEREAAAAVRDMAQAEADATRKHYEAQRAAQVEATELSRVAAAAKRASAATRTMADATRTMADDVGKSSRAANDNAGALARHAAGVRNLGQQFGDMAVMVQGGISPARAFATQAGQMGYAMSELGGKAGAVGRFLVGPWGIALTVATAALAPLVESLFKGGEAADTAKAAIGDLSAYVSDIGNFFDRATGKVKETNAALIQFAILSAKKENIGLRSAQRSAQEAGDEALAQSVRRSGSSGYARSGIGDVPQPATNTDVQDAIRSRRNVDGQLQAIAAGNSSNAALAGRILEQRATFARSAAEIAKNDAEVRSLLTGVLAPSLRTDTAAKPKRTPRAKSTAGLAEFGHDAGDKIAGIVGQFDTVPDMIDKASGKVRELDGIIRDLASKKPDGFQRLIDAAEAAKVTVRSGLIRELAEGFDKPKTLADKAAVAFGQLDAFVSNLQKDAKPGFERLIAEAQGARATINEALNKPMEDFLTGQREQLAVNGLLVRGRQAEADALRAILQIQKTGVVATAEQRDQVLASVMALRQQEQQLERIRAVHQNNLAAIDDMRQLAKDTIFEGPGSIAKLPERLFASFKNFRVEQLTQELFDDVFRDVREKATNAGKVDQASQTLVAAFAQTATAATQLGGALASVAASRTGGAGSAAVGAGAVAAGAIGAAGAATGASGNDAGGADVVVTAKRSRDVYGDSIAGLLRKFGVSDAKAPDDVKARDTAALIGKNAGKALAGAFEGQQAAGVAGMLGIKTSSTGAGIGGAIGGLTGLPGGSIVGGLLGGVVGGLFKSTKSGGATISDARSAVTTSGSSSAYQKAASGLAGSVQDTIAQIAERLGGGVGSFGAITIGKRGDDYRVNTTGSSSLKGKRGATNFGSDEAGAVAFAVQTAIERGAVTGLSAAVQRAIGSSSDLNKALKEALAVQDVEGLLGGSLAEYAKAFRQFEAQAKERVRIATQYGFDVVAIEKRNAEDRTKLAEQLAAAQSGSLKSLVDELTQGSLFEGSALDKIESLNSAIAKAKTDLENNVDGAGDRLAELYTRRLDAAKLAYGSTSGFASIRDQTLTDSQASIAKVNAQIAQASGGSDPALTTTNDALRTANSTLDEMADQNARMVSALVESNDLLRRIAGPNVSNDMSEHLRKLALY